MYNPYSLSDKLILVTGASSGIGQATAIECSKLGAQLIITGRNAERLQQTFEQLSGTGHRQILADLSKSSDVEQLVSVCDKLDGVVHCAGIVDSLLVQFCDEADIKQLFDVNAIAPILLTQLLVQNKLLKRGSSMVFITSISGVRCGYLGGSLYGATKAALEGYIKGTALELSSKRIRVNSVLAGMIDSPLLEKGGIDDETKAADIENYPMKRYGTCREVALAVVYCLSDATQWMTGSSLLIDGGYTLK